MITNTLVSEDLDNFESKKGSSSKSSITKNISFFERVASKKKLDTRSTFPSSSNSNPPTSSKVINGDKKNQMISDSVVDNENANTHCKMNIDNKLSVTDRIKTFNKLQSKNNNKFSERTSKSGVSLPQMSTFGSRNQTINANVAPRTPTAQELTPNSSPKTVPNPNPHILVCGGPDFLPPSQLNSPALANYLQRHNNRHFKKDEREMESFSLTEVVSDKCEVRSNQSLSYFGSEGVVAMIGGKTREGGFSRSTEIIEPEMNGITELPKLHANRADAATVYLEGGRLIVVGGYGVNGVMTSVELYDPCKRNWRVLPPMRLPRRLASVVHLGKTLYVLGGTDNITKGRVHKTMETINSTKFDSWTSFQMPRGRSDFAALSFRKHLVLIGGSSGVKVLDNVDVYDPANQKWISGVPSLNSGRCGHCAFVWKDSLVCFGGADNSSKRGDQDIQIWMPSEDWQGGVWKTVGSSNLTFSVSLIPRNLPLDEPTTTTDEEATEPAIDVGAIDRDKKGEASSRPCILKNLMASDVCAANKMKNEPPPSEHREISSLSAPATFDLGSDCEDAFYEQLPTDPHLVKKLATSFEAARKDPISWLTE